jgi:pimeloyl-ACP methyl ester carboxylesterase
MLTTTTADGTDVRAFDEGRGPVILVLHGGMDDGRTWRKVAAPLSARFRVLRLHRRRYRLDLPTRTPPTIAEEVGDVLALVAAAGAPVLVVGHSSGGVVALEAMVAAPSSFAGAVLYEPPVVTDVPLGAEAVARARVALAAGRPGKALTIFLRDIVRVPPLVATVAGVSAVHPRWRGYIPRQIDDADAIERLGNRLDAYAALAVPTILLGGERSPAHLGARLDALAGTMPHAEKVVMPRQGHAANVSAPAEVTRVVSTFADRVLY